jgi:hypothetical protein
MNKIPRAEFSLGHTGEIAMRLHFDMQEQGVLSPDERHLLRGWNIEGFAIVGAVCGLMFGVAYELSEVFLADPSEIESFGQIIMEVALATVSGALLCAAAAFLHRRPRLNR